MAVRAATGLALGAVTIKLNVAVPPLTVLTVTFLELLFVSTFKTPSPVAEAKVTALVPLVIVLLL
jgi:hypothetical protein